MADDFGVLFGLFRSDDHMYMIGQDYDGVYFVSIFLFAQCEAFSEKIDIIQEERLPSVRRHSDIVAVAIFEYSPVV